MIDFITLVADHLPDTYSLNSPSGYKIDADGAEYYREAYHRKLYFKLSRRIKTGLTLTISGSLKNFQNLENYTPMDFAQTTETIYALAKYVGLPPKQLRVTSMEASVPVATAPIDKLVKNYGNWAFMPMVVTDKQVKSTSQLYGVTAKGSKDYYSIKMYRKNEEQGIRFNRKLPQLQQVEVCIEKARFLRDKMNAAGIPSDCPFKGGVSLNDLTNPAVQHILCNMLVDIPNHITLNNNMASINYNRIFQAAPGMKEKRLQDLLGFAYSLPQRERMKEKSRSRYYELKKQVDQLQDLLLPASYKELQKFQLALQASVEAGRPKEPVSAITYVGKTSRKQAKASTLSTESVLVAD